MRLRAPKPAERSATAVQMATIAAASRKPLRAAGASARTGAVWVDTFAVRTEPFIGKCLNLSANAAGEQSRGTTRPPRGTRWPDCGIMERHAARLRVISSSVVLLATLSSGYPARGWRHSSAASRAGQQRATFVVSSVQKYPPTRLRRPNTVALGALPDPNRSSANDGPNPRKKWLAGWKSSGAKAEAPHTTSVPPR